MLKSPLSKMAALGAVYFALSPRMATPLYSPLLFHPDKYPIGDYHIDKIAGVMRRDVFFPSANGRVLHGWYFRQQQKSKTFIFHHGNGGNLATRLGLVQVLLEAGASVFIYDYQGFGRSEGFPSVQKLCEDGLAAHQYLLDKEDLLPEDIVEYGESLGSGVACYVTPRVECAGLVIQSGFESLRRVSGEHLPALRIYPAWLFPQPEFDNIGYLGNGHPPLLIIHGMRDGTVLFAHAEKMFANASGEKTFVRLPNSDHIDLYLQDAGLYRDGVRNYLTSLSSPGTAGVPPALPKL